LQAKKSTIRRKREKIIDEILVHAFNNNLKNPNMDTIRLDIDPKGRPGLHGISQF
jgi:hypothetical protein